MKRINIIGASTLAALEGNLVMTLLPNVLRRAARWGFSAVGVTCLLITTVSGTPSALDGFDPNANSSVRIVVVQPDGKILIGGDFTSLAPNGGVSVPRNHLARLNPDGSLDAAFNPNANTNVYSIAVQTDGRILVGGDFTIIGGESRNRIARLDATTGLADAFNPDANDAVYAVVVQADGQILAGGAFTGIGGRTRTNLARLEATTGTADSFAPNANGGVVNAIVVQSDGRILAGGSFTNFGGQPRNNIARLDATTGLADSFDPNANGVSRIAMQADGKILAAGQFTSIGGQTRNVFARLSNDTAALQNLAVTQSTITWTRGGSSRQFTRVTFEYTTDKVNYTPLGNGTPAGSNSTLTGLNLPTGQNFYIRARGYYRSGLANGSESITESVRNAFLVAQPLLTIQRSGNTAVVLSWATNFPGLTLEANPNLNTNVWSVVSPTPVVSGMSNVVTNAVSGSTRFYRLRKP